MNKIHPMDKAEDMALEEARIEPEAEHQPAEVFSQGRDITETFRAHLEDPHVQRHMARKIPQWDTLGDQDKLVALLSDNEMYQMITQATWR